VLDPKLEKAVSTHRRVERLSVEMMAAATAHRQAVLDATEAGHSLRKIGQRLGVTRGRVGQITAKAREERDRNRRDLQRVLR